MPSRAARERLLFTCPLSSSALTPTAPAIVRQFASDCNRKCEAGRRLGEVQGRVSAGPAFLRGASSYYFSPTVTASSSLLFS
jgi:hypothetical protein